MKVMKWMSFLVVAFLGATVGLIAKSPACANEKANFAKNKSPSSLPVTQATSRKAVKKEAIDLASLLTPKSSGITRSWEREEEAARSLERARKFKSMGAPIEDVCVRFEATRCVEYALDGFYKSLDALDKGERQSDVVITAMGNSLIAADGIVGRVRKRFQERFKNGGKGLLYADRIGDYGLRDRCGRAPAEHWKAFNLGMGKFGAHPYGMSAMQHVSTRKGARTRFTLGEEKSATLFSYDAKNAPAIDVVFSGVEKTIRVEPKEGFKTTKIDIPDGAKAMTLVAQGSNAVVQGIATDDKTHGVVLDTIGIPAIDARRFMRSDADIFEAQLKSRAPELTMIMLGGVENRRVSWRKYSFESVDKNLRDLIDRVQSARPNASCLVVGPIDATYGPLDEKVFGRPFQRYKPRAELFVTNKLQRAIAFEKGCAYYDQLASMGGSGTLKRWDKAGLMWKDLVHPRTKGLNLLGDLLTEAIRNHYLDRAMAKMPSSAEGVRLKNADALLETLDLSSFGLSHCSSDLALGFAAEANERFEGLCEKTRKPAQRILLSGNQVCFNERCATLSSEKDFAHASEKQKGALMALAFTKAIDANQKVNAMLKAEVARKRVALYQKKKSPKKEK